MTTSQVAGGLLIVLCSLCVTLGIAIFQSGKVTAGFSKFLCWSVPGFGMLCLILLIYAGFGVSSGGYSAFGDPLLSLACYVVAGLLPLMQWAAGLIARLTDTGA